jgi:long-subunit acyl-CoA synthetase (AMP-forming)
MQLYIDSTDPSRSLSTTEVRTQVRQLVSGLKSHGLKKSDCVCVVSFNDVCFVSSVS